MNTYKEGYHAGWVSYCEESKMTNGVGQRLTDEALHMAERARHALSPQQQGDYWLGYHHGRTAAKTCITKAIRP